MDMLPKNDLNIDGHPICGTVHHTHKTFHALDCVVCAYKLHLLRYYVTFVACHS